MPFGNLLLRQDLLRSSLDESQILPAVCVLDECFGIVSRPSDDDLHFALGWIIVMPVGSEPDNLVVQIDADLPRHAHDHRLADLGGGPLLPVRNEVLGDLLDALGGTNNSHLTCPA